MLILNAFQQSFEGTFVGVKFDTILPRSIAEPFNWVAFYLIKRGVTLEEKVKFLSIERAISVHDHGGHLEGEDEFMGFEDTHADELVEELGEFVLNHPQAGWQNIVLL
jgi:hypothetical protein